MEWSLLFFANSILLGVGLAMDAFSVSLANGLNEPNMRIGRMGTIAGVFAAFQAVMPIIGWVCVHTIVQWFQMFETLVPWIALILLLFIGGDMLIDGIQKKKAKGDEAAVEETAAAGFTVLIVQGVATSIDALSVGFTIAEYNFAMAAVCAGLIAVVTFVICMAGLALGKKFGTKFAGGATIFGGLILIAIGIEIFVKALL